MPDQTAPGLGLGDAPRPASRSASRPGQRAYAPPLPGTPSASPRSAARRSGNGFLLACLLAMLVAAVGIDHDVDKSPTDEDTLYIRRMMADAGHRDLPTKPAASFDGEIAQILQVQDAVLHAAPVNEGLALGQPREPRDLYEAGRGLCYDRSRSIEKAFALMGLETRHVAVYSLAEGRSAMAALLTNGTPSHALTEVRTRRGWMLVDSNDRWIGLLADGRPVSAVGLRSLAPGARSWSARVPAAMAPIFREPFVHVYGLYSRHGRFYPPMDPVPDVNLAELTQNL